MYAFRLKAQPISVAKVGIREVSAGQGMLCSFFVF